ncbi:anti-sigma factor antagonist [Metabacillus niabensis]|uniref:Anti-sigma factor antagonist n=1 Tax=Metabacillus niabensis TaxID=324854 RepID=A0ABT9Z728_9BACI|nr:anti-sigma factor antagonist [Metabacillus niabensis]MDQ0228070.1 anti-sigma B factor antagonist [Metabacillus niabensis]PAD66880.1 anti-anti-sigma factor [Bacillus sp. 7586-K]
MDIKIEITNNSDETNISITGEIDVYTAPKLRESIFPLAQMPNPSIVVSLANVSYMDSTGLGVFIGLLKMVRKNEGQLRLIELSERLVRLFRITGLNDIIDISSKSKGGVQ